MSADMAMSARSSIPVNGRVMRRAAPAESSCIETQGREIIATIVNTAVEEAMFRDRMQAPSGKTMRSSGEQ